MKICKRTRATVSEPQADRVTDSDDFPSRRVFGLMSVSSPLFPDRIVAWV